MTDDLARPAARPSTRRDLAAALPDLTSSLRLRGLSSSVDVWRDPEGTPHARAGSVHDAFFAQGFVHAQDRLWHMEYDRRRASGRWAELVGEAGVPQDALARRLGLDRSARLDYETAAPETRAMLDAYAAGVNAFLTHDHDVADRAPAPRSAAPSPGRRRTASPSSRSARGDGVVADEALARPIVRPSARLASICLPALPAPMLIIPPGVEYRGPASAVPGTLIEHDAVLADLPDWLGGSNNWVVSGSAAQPRARRSWPAIPTGRSTSPTSTTSTTSPAPSLTLSATPSLAAPA